MNLVLYANKTFALNHVYASSGQFTVRVNITDNKGGKGTDIANVTVNVYAFEGFYQPIDMGITNIANAGKTIPTKWHLSNVSGDVADPASFAALKSVAISCSQLTPLTDAIEEYAVSNSGLQYSGNGNWHYNWKTLKSYAGTCRNMYVEFKGGQKSPVVSFKFK